MVTTDLKRTTLSALLALLLVSWSVFADTDASAPEETGTSSAIILNKYLEATQTHDEGLRGASMEVDIDASVPKLKEQGRLHALRKISKVGQITYRVLGFQGDSTIKSQVIARYLQAEQQGQGDQSLAITSANYKFKYKGEKPTDKGKDVYVFQLSPRKKKVGLFKGEMWLDARTYLPIYEKGRFVKNPSIFFKKVDFERAFRIQNGLAIPQYTMSTIDARLIGKVELNISYSNFSQPAGDGDAAEDESDTATGTVAVAQ
jgi:hypothetical protein